MSNENGNRTPGGYGSTVVRRADGSAAYMSLDDPNIPPPTLDENGVSRDDIEGRVERVSASE